jgi:transcriptional regulator with GAF, ATPase, and Fis domain
MRAAKTRVLEAARQRSSEVPKFIGDSPAILKIWPKIEIASKSDLPVLILGEPGTGKELVAEIIHLASARRGLFNAYNSATKAGELQEDELFGHLEGAFTGAVKKREGLFLASENGTLFLDEVADMPAEVQAGILRALDPGKIRPRGSDVEIPVHVRIIAATNKDLQKERAERRFRSDLWSRLYNSLMIELPPLRQRLEDFGPLVECFAKGRKPTDKWLAELRGKSWEDGNVRDLKSAVKIAILRDDVWETPEQQTRSERDRIVAALREKKTKGDAADALGISRPTLDAWIKNHGIHDNEWKTSTSG